MMFNENPMLRVIFSIPILLIVLLKGIIIFFFYKGYIFLVESTPLNSIICISFHASLFLLFWSYYKAIITDPGTIPPNYKIPSISSLSLEENDKIKAEQYCGKCEMERPPRCHHCPVCNRCILKMDYHCPIIGNCVGFFNIRYVCQLMVYASLCSTIVGSCCGYLFVINKGEASLFTLCGMITGLGLSAGLPALAALNFWLIVNNRSIMELQENSFDNKYDLGDSEKNISLVCGKSILGYILPIDIKYEGDGVNYEISKDYCKKEEQNTENTASEGI